MNPTVPCVSSWLKNIVLLCVAGLWLIASSAPLAAAAGPRKLLKLELSGDRRTAEVQVPPGFGSVTLQRFDREGGWRKFATKSAVPGAVKFKLPATGKAVRWRAIGRFEIESVARGKFPAGFYKGENRFGPLKGRVGNGIDSRLGILSKEGAADGAVQPGGAPVEADIWQTDGSTVYFFNQLRGLQVLDVSNPADPRLTASLRMPAVGEDLYLLPGAGGVRFLVLLTEQPSTDGSLTRINLVRVEGGKAEITHHQDVPGQLSDSRMVGMRLILATTDWGRESGLVGISNEASVGSQLSEWVIAPGLAPQPAGKFSIRGQYPEIAAGKDWLAVAVTPPGVWDFSEVSVFALAESGLSRLTPKPLRTAGVVADKFKMQWSNHVLTTISERNGNSTGWSPTTVLETFRVWGRDVVVPAVVTETVRLGKLELAKGESLFATRFAGNKAYVVTFLQTDPLWVVDLADPKNPVVAGHIEVPGWSSHLEPIGDLLFAIGWESNSVAASLFDVANPAAPKLLRRLNLGSPGSYSEAAWDEQAMKVLPDAGLALVPLTSYDDKTGESTAVVQLLDLDLAGGDLKSRGTISHDFDARRADLLGNAVVSISQRVLVAADIADRDAPKLLSEVSLAWPVDRVLDAGAHMLQIEAGGSYGNGRATVRVSPADAPEAVLAETDLGEGTVCGADFREGRLFIVREIGSFQALYYRSPVIGKAMGSVVLDVFDASSLPALSLLGSCSTTLKAGEQVGGRLLWPQPNRPAVVLDARSSFWFGGDGPIVIDPPILLKTTAPAAKTVSSLAVDRFPFWRPRSAPRLAVFDITNPGAPTVAQPVAVGTAETIPNQVCEAADGLVVMGASDWRSEVTGAKLPDGRAFQSVHVVEVAGTGVPVVRPGIDLPGELFAVTDLDGDGFLAFTRNFDGADGAGVQVSACDGFDAFEVAGLDGAADVAAAGGRRLFVAKGAGVERYRLTNEGALVAEDKLVIGWKPETLRWARGILLGGTWNSLFAAEATAGTARKWRFPVWSLRLDQISVATDGDLLVPFGDYGAERLER